jgi:predicted kinase
MQKPIAFMLIGLPGSGKSTWSKPHIENGVSIISSDDYIDKVAMEKGLTYSQVFDAEIKNATAHMNQQIQDLTTAKKPLIWDQTNLTPKSRKPKIDKLKKAGYEIIGIAFECPIDEIYNRIAQRTKETGKHIPRKIVNQMSQSYIKPTASEGFTKIIIVTLEGERVL